MISPPVKPGELIDMDPLIFGSWGSPTISGVCGRPTANECHKAASSCIADLLARDSYARAPPVSAVGP